MRVALCESLLKLCVDPDFVFLTGDLGYNALEPLQAKAGNRFINAGIAEQNMVSVAAGLARTGLRPWVYSIAPFIYARPYEQIRNDVCLHNLPVVVVGNGGGYAYGVMGGTHHAIEDYGAILALQNITAYIPAFSEDVAAIADILAGVKHPAYLRLGRCEKPKGFVLPDYSPWRKLTEGGGATLLITGPLAGPILREAMDMEAELRPNLWVLSQLPVVQDTLPDQFLSDITTTRHLIVVEEHVASGGVGQMIAAELLRIGSHPLRFTHHHAHGYGSGTYGSQGFHRRENRLDAASVIDTVRS